MRRYPEIVLPPICILAGGLGTRLGEIVQDVPKPLVEVAGEPFLCHQIRQLAEHGAARIVLCVGHLGEAIESRIGYEQDGVTISYSYDAPNLEGTLGAIRRARHLLSDRFLVLYGDTYLQVDFNEFTSRWLQSSMPGAMSVYRNDNALDRSNVVYEDGRIILYDKFDSVPEMHWIDYGLGGLDVATLDIVGADERDLAALYHRLSLRNELFGYEVNIRFYEIGTPESLRETDEMLRGRQA